MPKIRMIYLPSLPPELRSGTCGEVQKRLQLRARLMAEAFVDENGELEFRFSSVASNPLGVAQAKKLGVPGAGYPRLIYDNGYTVAPFPFMVERVWSAFEKWSKISNTPYLTFTTLFVAADIWPSELFSTLRYMKTIGYTVTFTVDRLGNNTACKIEEPSLHFVENLETGV